MVDAVAKILVVDVEPQIRKFCASASTPRLVY